MAFFRISFLSYLNARAYLKKVILRIFGKAIFKIWYDSIHFLVYKTL